MPLLTLLKKQLTPTKLFFHFVFWTFHWAIFAYGWYAIPEGG
jgi:NADPH oxidase